VLGFGSLCSMTVSTANFRGACDPRKGGGAIGY